MARPQAPEFLRSWLRCQAAGPSFPARRLREATLRCYLVCITSNNRRGRNMVRSIPHFRFGAALFAGALACAPLPAAAQQYPSQPIKIIVPTAPGGVADIVARAFGQKLNES